MGDITYGYIDLNSFMGILRIALIFLFQPKGMSSYHQYSLINLPPDFKYANLNTR
ncbi:hypothetical protein Lspi_1976 [Legionella spiritensis]|uniref:Uncharacterized protein n=1 Tax=Legionella spiritensis TaxID=452 RepID=A0A0W0YZP5_LEGSP|nr:hypothetical protein Lspi_1976 [Legionella spiritensis]